MQTPQNSIDDVSHITGKECDCEGSADSSTSIIYSQIFDLCIWPIFMHVSFLIVGAGVLGEKEDARATLPRRCIAVLIHVFISLLRKEYTTTIHIGHIIF